MPCQRLPTLLLSRRIVAICYPTTPTPDPPMLPPSSSKRKQHSQQHQRHQHPETTRCPCKTITPSGSGTPCSHSHQSGHRGEQRCSYCCSSSDRISSSSPSGSIHSSNSAIIDKASSLSVIPYLILLILHSLM